MRLNNKRIIHAITLSSVGGAQSVVVNLANSQCISNEVFVISSSSGEAWKALNPSVRVIAIKELQRDISLKDIAVIIKLFYWRIKLKPDVVQLHSSKMGMFGRLVFSRKKTIYTVHGFDSMRIANRKFLIIEKLLKNSCQYIVGVSKYDVTNLKYEGIYKNVSLVYNGVADHSILEPTIINQNIIDRVSELRKKYKRIIISIARDDAPKRIDLFLELAKQMPKYAFVWVGNSNEYNKTDNVLLLGQLSMGHQILVSGDLFVLCSDFEGLPMSIIEALLYSKPIVASKVGGVAEIIDGTNGYAVDNRVDEFKNAILTILEGEDYRKYSIAARQTYEDRFTLDKMVEGYDNLYYSICAQR